MLTRAHRRVPLCVGFPADGNCTSAQAKAAVDKLAELTRDRANLSFSSAMVLHHRLSGTVYLPFQKREGVCCKQSVFIDSRPPGAQADINQQADEFEEQLLRSRLDMEVRGFPVTSQMPCPANVRPEPCAREIAAAAWGAHDVAMCTPPACRRIRRSSGSGRSRWPSTAAGGTSSSPCTRRRRTPTASWPSATLRCPSDPHVGTAPSRLRHLCSPPEHTSMPSSCIPGCTQRPCGQVQLLQRVLVVWVWSPALPHQRAVPALQGARVRAETVSAGAATEVHSPLRLYVFSFLAAVLFGAAGLDALSDSPSTRRDILYVVLGTGMGATAIWERSVMPAPRGLKDTSEDSEAKS